MDRTQELGILPAAPSLPPTQKANKLQRPSRYCLLTGSSSKTLQRPPLLSATLNWEFPSSIHSSSTNTHFLSGLQLRLLKANFTLSPKSYSNHLYWSILTDTSVTPSDRTMGLEGTSRDHLVQPPWLKQAHPEQVAQDRPQAGLESLRGRRLHTLCGQPLMASAPSPPK